MNTPDAMNTPDPANRPTPMTEQARILISAISLLEHNGTIELSIGAQLRDAVAQLERSLAAANERHLLAVLCIGHWDLHYHGLLSAVRSLLITRRKLTDAQSAVLTSVLDELAEKAQSKPPAWPVSDEGHRALLSLTGDAPHHLNQNKI